MLKFSGQGLLNAEHSKCTKSLYEKHRDVFCYEGSLKTSVTPGMYCPLGIKAKTHSPEDTCVSLPYGPTPCGSSSEPRTSWQPHFGTLLPVFGS